MGRDYAERARALVGTRFRPQGRDADGLDCIGVIVATFAIDPASVRNDYRLRSAATDEFEQALRLQFRKVPLRQLRPGDVMLMSIDAQQVHLGVRTAAGFVHAHAGLRRVVETPGLPQWPLRGAYRKRIRGGGR